MHAHGFRTKNDRLGRLQTKRGESCLRLFAMQLQNGHFDVDTANVQLSTSDDGKYRPKWMLALPLPSLSISRQMGLCVFQCARWHILEQKWTELHALHMCFANLRQHAHTGCGRTRSFVWHNSQFACAVTLCSNASFWWHRISDICVRRCALCMWAYISIAS